jgi:hypothetical protein
MNCMGSLERSTDGSCAFFLDLTGGKWNCQSHLPGMDEQVILRQPEYTRGTEITSSLCL